MQACVRCGSFAINPTHHGRDGTDYDLCDVCYWRKRAEASRSADLEVKYYTQTDAEAWLDSISRTTQKL